MEECRNEIDESFLELEKLCEKSLMTMVISPSYNKNPPFPHLYVLISLKKIVKKLINKSETDVRYIVNIVSRMSVSKVLMIPFFRLLLVITDL